MAELMISYTWATGEQVVVSVDLEDSFPDAVAEAEASTRRLFAYSMGVIRAYDQAANAEAPAPEPPEAGE